MLLECYGSLGGLELTERVVFAVLAKADVFPATVLNLLEQLYYDLFDFLLKLLIVWLSILGRGTLFLTCKGVYLD